MYRKKKRLKDSKNKKLKLKQEIKITIIINFRKIIFWFSMIS